MTVKLDRILLSGQIEKGYDYSKFIKKIGEGLVYLHQNIEPFEPTRWAKDKYGPIIAESRRIDVMIRNKDIYYLVIDEGKPFEEKMEYPIRAKGYFQNVENNEIKEVPTGYFHNLAEAMRIDVGKGLIE